MQEVQLCLAILQKAEGQTDKTVLEMTGKASQRNSSWYLQYKEQIEGVGEVSNIVRINDDCTQLLRQGSLQMKQIFEKGQGTDSLYSSPYGDMQMHTHTRTYKVTYQSEKPIQVFIAYQLWLSGQYVGEFEWDMKIAWE
ncbi:hypothetical protein C2W64_03357 [Brevibacillus laterosporus]|nr:DUF1934 domain-containing protein [Brevibacillus laterosporus]RAP29707.1 hypothetical protein C2W64_03357 [Brevibacillus laterosporus]